MGVIFMGVNGDGVLFVSQIKYIQLTNPGMTHNRMSQLKNFPNKYKNSQQQTNTHNP